ncbi:armadillo-type protein [Mycena latifolia]|nr:armadillo-type protein [Mycena latifolia]
MSPPIQPDRQSLISWWSDSNYPGVTIPLHTLAKPLSSFLHHRQAIGFITKWRGFPLSQERDKYIFPSTKAAIIHDLGMRAVSEDQAQEMAARDALPMLVDVLNSTDRGVLERACWMLGNIAIHQSLSPALVEFAPCVRLVLLSQHTSIVVRREAIYALCQITAGSESAARAVLDANILLYAKKFLDSTDAHVLECTCCMLGNLAQHVEITPYKQLVPLLRNPNPDLPRASIYALRRISGWHERSARAVVTSGALPGVRALLDSPEPDVLECACVLLGNVARHRELAPAVIRMTPLSRLTALLLHEPAVQTQAAYALQWILETNDFDTNMLLQPSYDGLATTSYIMGRRCADEHPPKIDE